MRSAPADIEAIARGITIDGVSYRGAEFVEEYGQGDSANRWYRCVLTEGKNREIRKLFDHFGCVVNRLVRLQYGPFLLGDLVAGEIREVPPGKVKEFVDYLAKKGVSCSLCRHSGEAVIPLCFCVRQKAGPQPSQGGGRECAALTPA